MYLSPMIFLAVFIFTVNASIAQESIKNYVKNNTVVVQSIEPDSTNYADLVQIGAAIGDARIVMLGEQDHGDAPTFTAKTRLIKYLHEKKGFNVLAFESDFFALNYGWDKLPKGSNAAVDSFLNHGIYPLWTNCNACQPLFRDYIPSTLQTNGLLHISGFDNQMATPFLAKMLDSTIRGLALPIVMKPDYSTEIVPLIRSGGSLKDSVVNNKYLSCLAQIKTELIGKLNIDNFWVQVIDNLVAGNHEYATMSNWGKSMNIRDDQMASNIKWLASIKYPKEKIIVWAHNYHVSKYAGHYPDKFLNNLNTMGTVFTSDSSLMKQTYILGFTSYEGRAGRLYPRSNYKVTKPERNSFENWIDSKYDFAFVDFKRYNQRYNPAEEDFYMSGAIKGNMYHKNAKAQWNKVFDGVFFIRHMYPCERAK
jgi:erythromycin esterase-like protein